MSDGLGIKHDRKSMPGGDTSQGHSMIYPTKYWSVTEFKDLFNLLLWGYGGKI